MPIVYVLRNKINGKVYVGQTIRTLKHRLRSHLTCKRSAIGASIRKYGKDNFLYISHEVPERLLDDLERSLIRRFSSLSPNGYNLESGGNSHKHAHPETRAKMSRAQKGRAGKPWSDEARRHFSEARKGRRLGPPSVETVRKITEACRGRALRGSGWHHSPETRAKIAQSNSGERNARSGKEGTFKNKRHSPETRNRMSELRKARSFSDEDRKKFIQQMKGKRVYVKGGHHSLETRKKMSEARIGKPHPRRKADSKWQLDLDL